MSFNDFFHKYRLKKSNNITYKNLSTPFILSLCDVSSYFKDGPFESDTGTVNIHPRKGTHWVAYINENYFDSYGCSTPQKAL